MTPVMLFGDELEAANHLSLEEQQELIAILQRPVAETGRQRLIAEVQEARREFAAGLGRPVTAAELMREVLEYDDADTAHYSGPPSFPARA
jgi:hypothetical protein